MTIFLSKNFDVSLSDKIFTTSFEKISSLNLSINFIAKIIFTSFKSLYDFIFFKFIFFDNNSSTFAIPVDVFKYLLAFLEIFINGDNFTNVELMSIAFINIEYLFCFVNFLLFSVFSLKMFFLLFKFSRLSLEFVTKILLEYIATS